MIKQKYIDLTVDQGSDWSAGLTLNQENGSPMNLTNCVFQGAFRTSYPAANVSGNLTITTVDSANGTALLSMNAATTANITAGKYVYDVILIDSNGINTRILQGILTISPGVTIQ